MVWATKDFRPRLSLAKLEHALAHDLEPEYCVLVGVIVVDADRGNGGPDDDVIEVG